MGKSAYPYLVTGATGFIGGRVIEKLCLEGWGVPKALVHTPSNAINIARFPVQMIQGSMTDDKAIAQAVEGVDTVFHCAHLFDGDTADNQIAMRTLLKAADKQGVRRVIVLSTADVYQPGQSHYVTEATPYKPYGSSPYIDAKKGIEQVCRNYEGARPEVVVIQPTIVYGPWGKAWTQRIFDQMASGKVQLVNKGSGICNCIYIDDLVDMMIKAAKQPNIDGETFIASNPTPLTWKQFYGYFEEIIGQKRTVEQLKASKSAPVNWPKPDFRKCTLNLRHKITPLLPRNFKDWVKAELRKWQNTDKPIPLTEEQERYFASTAKFDVRKAVDKLGFVPAFKHEEGFNQVNHWYHHFYSS
jgi:nucleoside-diphosphate-sugar epimerase